MSSFKCYEFVRPPFSHGSCQLLTETWMMKKRWTAFSCQTDSKQPS